MDQSAKGEAREAMEETAFDTRSEAGVEGGKTSSKRRFFDDNVMTATHERNLSWESVKRVLGNSHSIFKHFNNKGEKTKSGPDRAPLTSIKNLASVMKLTRWRQESEYANMLHLTDEQRTEVVVALEILHTKLQNWGTAQRKSLAEKKKSSFPCVVVL